MIDLDEIERCLRRDFEDRYPPTYFVEMKAMIAEIKRLRKVRDAAEHHCEEWDNDPKDPPYPRFLVEALKQASDPKD